MSAKERRAYDGPGAKLVLAFDVGTTYSGVSYAIMEPGEVPEIQSITRSVLASAKEFQFLNHACQVSWSRRL
jgi:hypothetical protein